MIDEFLAGDLTEVEAAVRAAAAAEIMPRFRQLAADEIVEKSGPHDLVTVADRLAEEHLTAALTRLLPGSVVVGEEAVHADPAVYDALGGDAPVWIVDPVDGTRQFVRGEPGFCTLVALAHRGELLASWTYAAALDEMAIAVRGRGATLDGEPIRAGSPVPGAVLHVAMSHPDYTTDAQKHALLGLRTEGSRPGPAVRRGSNTSTWPSASRTRWPSTGSTPGITRRACCWSPRRAVPRRPSPGRRSVSPAATPCRSRRPATRRPSNASSRRSAAGPDRRAPGQARSSRVSAASRARACGSYACSCAGVSVNRSKYLPVTSARAGSVISRTVGRTPSSTGTAGVSP